MLKFQKYHGAGNDFIMIDNREKVFDVKDIEKIKFLCDRHLGIGADGIIFLENSDKANCFMNYCNSDGTFVEMCGNGIRCLAKFFLEQTKPTEKELLIDTRDGIKKIFCNDDGSVSVNMGIPVFSHNDFPSKPLTLENTLFYFVSMGNPHAVGFVKNISKINLSEIGPKIENNSVFKNKINVEFVEKITDEYFKVRVWERGSCETLSCGTGACAVYAILKKDPSNLLKTSKEITLEFSGGKLYLSENPEGQIILRGPATKVFEGEIEL